MKLPITFIALLASAAAWFRPGPEVMDPDLREFARHLTMIDAPIDPFGHTARTAVLTGLNLQLTDGSGYTDNHHGNGTGNIILGYNELGMDPTDRLGSHNLVIGRGNSWSEYACAGFVAGWNNYIMADDCAILGGTGNTAFGWMSVVVGGVNNQAVGEDSVVGGGFNRAAYGADDFAAGSILEDE